MSDRNQRPSLLSKNFSTLFSPVRVNADILETDKPLALYEFASIFLPSMGPSIFNLLLDMERHSKKLIAAIEPEKRERLINDLEGMTVEIHYVIKDKGKELMVLPINICPAEVLRNASLTKHGSRYTEKMQEEMNQILTSFIKKEIQHKIKTIIESSLETLIAKPRMPVMIKELLCLGLINKEGRLAEGATIEDLISGKYARLFKEVVPEELINEALMIKEAIKACYDWEGVDSLPSANEALVEKGILEITLGEIGGRGQEAVNLGGMK
ncbi:MAG: hypothetical protein WCQ90_07320 [Deltaproteobacteria bacterium]